MIMRDAYEIKGGLWRGGLARANDVYGEGDEGKDEAEI